MISRWKISESGRRNEALDTMLMAEAAARFKDWHWMPMDRWDELAAERGTAPEDAQGDLFADAPVAPKGVEPAAKAAVNPSDVTTEEKIAPPVTWAAPARPKRAAPDPADRWISDKGVDWL